MRPRQKPLTQNPRNMQRQDFQRVQRALRVTWFAAVVSVLPVRVWAQTAVPDQLTLKDAVQLAVRNYPAIKERRARAQAAEEGIDVARTAYLPRLDLVWQENRATTNNVFGLLLPQAIVPSISGPVLGTRTFDSVWGSAAGVMLSWDALDFGQRKANVDVARAQTSVAKAQTAVTELDAASAAADAFLTVLAADESVRAARANVDRLQARQRAHARAEPAASGCGRVAHERGAGDREEPVESGDAGRRSRPRLARRCDRRAGRVAAADRRIASACASRRCASATSVMFAKPF